jgi:hypothetical protein
VKEAGLPAPAPQAVTFDSWMEAHRLNSLGSGRKKKVSGGQVSLLDLLD